MTKTLMFTLIGFVVLQVTLGVISKQCPYGRCASYVEHIADELCKYRHDHGRWPANAAEIIEQGILAPGEKLESLFGVPLKYDPEACSLTSPCSHAGIPLLSWITFTGYYSGCESHGISLTNRYEQLYGK